MLRLCRPLVVLGAIFAFMVAGCGGGGDTDAERVRRAIGGYFSGLVEGDGQAACQHVSTAGRIELAELAAVSGVDSVDCATIVEEISGGIGANDADRLREVRVSSVEVEGDRASATIRGASVKPSLIRSDGNEWLIDSGFAP